MKRILVDVDGVLADFTGHLCKELAKDGQPRLTDNDLTEWDLKACFPKPAHKAIDALMSRPGFFASIPRYPGAQAFHKALKKRGDVTAVTTVKGLAAQERYDWLLSLGFQDHEIVLVEEHNQKVSVMGDAIIDDRIETLALCNHRVKIVFDRPWNRRSPHHPSLFGIGRARDYDHVLRHLDAAGIR